MPITGRGKTWDHHSGRFPPPVKEPVQQSRSRRAGAVARTARSRRNSRSGPSTGHAHWNAAALSTLPSSSRWRDPSRPPAPA